MLKIGVFGGTFNPVHKGHEKTAVEFYRRFNIDKLLVIPTFITPQKQIDEKVLPVQRFEMCKLAFDAEEYNRYNIEVSDIEIKKEGKSYSVDTVKALCEIYGAEESVIYLLVGTDMFLTIESWFKYRELLDMCVLVVAFRYNQYNQIDNCEDGKNGEIFAKKKRLEENGFRIELLENSVFEISSTELRSKINDAYRDNGGLSRWLSAGVIEYIKEKRLYNINL